MSTDGGTELHCREVPAEADRLPALRRALADWAENVGLSADQRELAALATYEALANAATHAYSDGESGVLDVHAIYRPTSGHAEVVVTDYGHWQEPGREDLGGRGLVLISSLAEHAEVTVTAGGTTVRMSWTVAEDVERSQPASR